MIVFPPTDFFNEETYIFKDWIYKVKIIQASTKAVPTIYSIEKRKEETNKFIFIGNFNEKIILMKKERKIKYKNPFTTIEFNFDKNQKKCISIKEN